jgi:SAM-dependent methyltransferase
VNVWQEVYDGGAARYAAVLEPTFFAHAERIVELAGPSPETRLLDLATGTGTVARLAAARGATVVGVDASPQMLETGLRLAPTLDLRVADACALPFPDGVYDVVTCGLAVTHFVDLDSALAEVQRVLRPGGTFVASAWGERGSNPARIVGELVDRYAAPAEHLDERTWAVPTRGVDILERAGFSRVFADTRSFDCAFADAEEALAWVVASPVTASRLARLEPERRELLFLEARDALACVRLTGSFSFNYYVASTPLRDVEQGRIGELARRAELFEPRP